MDRNFNHLLNIRWKIGQARKSLWIETDKLSKAYFVEEGQARKSLWIETLCLTASSHSLIGQARKSLWIETPLNCWQWIDGNRSGS